MKPFPSLEEFLASFTDRHLVIIDSAKNWLTRYQVALDSYERANGNPPPVGSLVTTLRSGFSGGAGEIRIVAGVRQDTSGTYLELKSKDMKLGPSLCNIDTWWQDIYLGTLHFDRVFRR